MRTCVKRSPVTTYRKKRTLANTQEETRQKNADKVVGGSDQDTHETPKDNTGGEVNGGFPEPVEEHVPISSLSRIQQTVRAGSRTKDIRGNLHGDIPDIEDTQNGVKLVISESQILLETAQTGSAR